VIPRSHPHDPHPREPNFVVPTGAVDCHAHIFGPVEVYPLAEGRSYTPPEASLDQYRELHRTLGVTRGVLIQPSVYGFDNRCMIDALRQLGPNYRGVAVVRSDCSDDELDALHEVGVRGLRTNVLFGGGNALEDAVRMAGRIRRLGWHLQFLVDVSKVADLKGFVRRLEVPVVIDHMGHAATGTALREPGFLDLLELLRLGQCRVKLSGSYRITSERLPPYGDVAEVAKALIDAGPAHCLWATDWPHPQIPVPMPNDGDLMNQLPAWSTDQETTKRILVDNPASFYGFA
jgi:predicted TIM-barrel fold metal-dependent hydrolase